VATSVRLKALVVGSGWARHAASTFAARPELEVVALARDLGVPSFADLGAAISAVKPRVAVVAIDEASNAAMSERLVEAGCDVLCAHPVARTIEGVRRLEAAARQHGRIVSTDYSMRTTAEFRAAQGAIAESGALMRLALTYPGRLLPIALDLGIAVGGPLAAVSAFAVYPRALAERRIRTPAAFPPTVVLEHVGGCVSTLVPCTHATTAGAFALTASCAEARIELRLPTGGAELVRLLRRGRSERVELVPPRLVLPAIAAFAYAMGSVANAFVDAVLVRGTPPCPLSDEVAVRGAWQGIMDSLRYGGRAEARSRDGWE
jgi:hypothetical protein